MSMQPFTPSNADPGIGNAAAEVGSVAWAQWLRLHLQSVVKRVDKEPRHVAGLFDVLKQHRAWTLLNKQDGSLFATFEDFCAYRLPWGLGRPYDEIRPFLEAAVGKNALALMTVPPAKAPSLPPGPGRGHKVEKPKGHDVPLVSDESDEGAEKKAKRLRAVLRSPEPVQAAYRSGLIGQVEAAKLGPRDPEPERAARIVEVTRAIAPIVERAKAAPKPERAKIKREVNAKVREMLGAKPKPYARLLAALMELSSDDLRAVIANARRLLAERGDAE